MVCQEQYFIRAVSAIWQKESSRLSGLKFFSTRISLKNHPGFIGNICRQEGTIIDTGKYLPYVPG